LAVRHIVIEQGDRFSAELRKNLMTNLCSDEHESFVALADFLRGHGSTVYDGIGGSIFSAGLFLDSEKLKLYRSGRLLELAEVLLGNNEPILAKVFPYHLYRQMGRECAIEHLTNELARHGDAPNPIGSFYFWNRTRREIALCPYGLLADMPLVYSPYLDHDLYDLLAGLPAETLLDHRLHTEAIQRAYPRYADIPFEDKSAQLMDSREENWRFVMQLAQCVRGSKRWRSKLMRNSYVLPRLFRCLIDRQYGETTGWITPLLLYLFQLERLSDREIWPFTNSRPANSKAHFRNNSGF
jgi:hypothetical protein